MIDSIQQQPPLARQVNIAAALDAFWSGEPVTVNDIMQTTRLTRATVHSVCNDLIERGWIVELMPRPDAIKRTGGRPSRTFQLNRQAAYVMGIDLGLEHLHITVADLAGESCFDHRFDLRARSGRRRREALENALDYSLRHAGVSPQQVVIAGIGLSAPVSRDGTVIGFGSEVHNQHWARMRRDQAILRHLLVGITVLTANDANLAVLGERWKGAAQGVDDVIVILATEGLGTGIMEDGHILNGVLGGAGEMSWLDLVDVGIGADGFVRAARDIANEQLCAADPPSIAEDIARVGTRNGNGPFGVGRRFGDVLTAAARGDAFALGVVTRLASSMASVVCILSILLNPALVVLVDAPSAHQSVLLDEVTQRMTQISASPPRVVLSGLGDKAVAVGAVRFALNHVQTNVLDIKLANNG